VERERDPEALFAGHLSVPGDLFLERGLRIHRVIYAPGLRSSPRIDLCEGTGTSVSNCSRARLRLWPPPFTP
jgi:hypothetical protein